MNKNKRKNLLFLFFFFFKICYTFYSRKVVIMESKSLKIILDEIDKRIGGLKVQVDKIRSESLDKLQKEFHTNLYYLTLDDIINSTTTTKNKLIEIKLL